MDKSISIAMIILSIAMTAATLFFFPAIPQDIHYHDFADQRKIFAIPHFFNVITNLPFLALGIMGLRLVASNHFSGGLSGLREAYTIFFSGILLVGLGSGFYHLNPENESLIWDRLPMTISFMTFFSIVVGENIAIEAGTKLLYPSIILGLLSVVYWYWGELHEQGDLRFYALIQFLPMLLIPVILVSGQARFTNNGYLWGLLAAYAAAKLAEYGDNTVYQLSGFFSGHSLKHLLAASGIWFFYLGLTNRVRLR